MIATVCLEQINPTSLPGVTVVTGQQGEVCGADSCLLSVGTTTMQQAQAVPCSEATRATAMRPTTISHCLSPPNSGTVCHGLT